MERDHHEDGEAAQVAQGQARLGHAADRDAISSHGRASPRYRAAAGDSEGPAAFFGGCYYALIPRPYNACLPGSGGELAFNGNKAGLIAALTGLAYGVAARMGGHSHNR